jgi:phosphocarrier protein FPr
MGFAGKDGQNAVGSGVVGLVVVAHSRSVAEGVCSMAAQMSQGRIPILPAGGVGESGALGTDATLIVESIRSLLVHPECGGILVLADLGSAILSAETALELLAGESTIPIQISRAPLVEGAVAAAVAAAAGKTLEEVEAEACATWGAKLGPSARLVEESEPTDLPSDARVESVLGHPHGLHVRPAAAFISRGASYGVVVRVRDLTTGSAWVDGASLTQLVTLGSRQGDRLEIAVSGSHAEQAATDLSALLSETHPESGSSGQAPRRVEFSRGAVGRGIPASPGRVVGPVLRVRAEVPVVPREKADHPSQEIDRLRQAIRAAHADLVRLMQRASDGPEGPQAALLSAHTFLLKDPVLVRAAESRIETEGWTAEAAWDDAVQAAGSALEAHSDEYVRARAADVRDVGGRVLRLLLGESGTIATFDRPGILVAQDLSPTQIVELDPRNVLGICTAGGSSTSHASILARALLIPAVVGCGEGVLGLVEGTQVMLDGDEGTLAIEPADASAGRADPKRQRSVVDRLADLAEAHLPAVTLDGRRIEVAANIGSLIEAKTLGKYGAEGVGVLRTEFLHLGRQQPPDEEEQLRVYRDILRACAGRPVIARTLDVGGDKRLPYLEPIEEDNPFLGMRGLRLSLQVPDLFRCQLRALMRAGVEGGLQLMFPMVTTVDELRQARKVVDEARDELSRRGEPHAEELPIGMMVEVPAAALMAERFAGEVGFMSIGTNDLAQYTQAAERTNPRMLELGDPASPALLRLIADVVRACQGAGIWAGVCGEMAADPRLLPVLIGLGIDELSMTPAAIPRIKAQIRGLEWEATRRLAVRALGATSAGEVRGLAAELSPSQKK